TPTSPSSRSRRTAAFPTVTTSAGCSNNTAAFPPRPTARANSTDGFLRPRLPPARPLPARQPAGEPGPGHPGAPLRQAGAVSCPDPALSHLRQHRLLADDPDRPLDPGPVLLVRISAPAFLQSRQFA